MALIVEERRNPRPCARANSSPDFNLHPNTNGRAYSYTHACAHAHAYVFADICAHGRTISRSGPVGNIGCHRLARTCQSNLQYGRQRHSPRWRKA